MNYSRGLKLLILSAFGIASFGFGLTVFAATSNKNINVQMNVAPITAMYCGDGICNNSELCDVCTVDCGICGGGETNDPPSIKEVVSAPGYTSAIVDWKATDYDGTVSGCTFNYDTYSDTVIRNGENFSVNLSSLTEGVLYNFTIICTDNGGASASQTGSFTTLIHSTPLLITTYHAYPGVTTASISWSTNKESDGLVQYGTTIVYTGSVSHTDLRYVHDGFLLNLLPSTLYHYRIISAVGAESASTTDDTFTTLADNIAPPDVSNFTLATTSNSIVLNWVNPDLISAPDFDKVILIRKIGSAPTGPSDGDKKYEGTGTSFTDTDVTVGTVYYYKIFTYDTSVNHSNGVYVFGSIFAELPKCGDGHKDPLEACDNGSNNGACPQVCSDSCMINSCAVCGNGVQETGEECDKGTQNGSPCPNTCGIDCKLNTCATPVCGNGVQETSEECDDGVTNGDCPASCSAVSCKKNSCGGHCGNGVVEAGEACEPALVISKACADINSDWTQGVLACNSNCSFNSNDCHGGITIPGFTQLKIEDLQFLGGTRNIVFTPRAGTVSSLVGSNFSIGVRKDKLISAPIKIELRLGNERHSLILDTYGSNYFTDIIFPGGDTQAYLDIDYGGSQTDSVGFKLSSLPLAQIHSDEGMLLSGVLVSLYNRSGLFVASSYGQMNPLSTGGSGTFGWVVPPGEYFLRAQVDGYYTRETQLFSVTNNVVNNNLSLVTIPPKLLDVIDPNATVAENVVNVAKNLEQKTIVVAETVVNFVQDVAQNPAAEQTSQVVAPAVVGVTAVGTISFVSFANILNFLRFLFLQPILVLGRRKRDTWGQVYNALSKLPIDLATVRLFDLATGRLVRSRVTDKNGRFIFIVDPGKYRLEVFKDGFVYPSKLLAELKTDGRRADVYHGEEISVAEKDTLITANIPLDPTGVVKTPRRVYWEKFWRRLQVFISWLGLIVTVVSLYISPKWYMWVLLGVHISLFFIFKRLSVVPKPKGWGIVYDETTKKPVGRAVARLFDSHFNKLVSTEITDRNGRYSFLAGDSKFYVTYDKIGYDSKKTANIDLAGKESGSIVLDVGLNKTVPLNDQPPTSPPVTQNIPPTQPIAPSVNSSPTNPNQP